MGKFLNLNEKINVKFKKLHKDAIIPKFQKEFDSGMDLHSIEETMIKYGEITCVHTGLCVELLDQSGTYPFTLEMQIRCRSGLSAKQGITVVNGIGTIDNMYRGELMILLTTLKKDHTYYINKGDRIAQAVITPVLSSNILNIIEVDELSETIRGTGGFGSTGLK